MASLLGALGHHLSVHDSSSQLRTVAPLATLTGVKVVVRHVGHKEARECHSWDAS